MSAIQHAHNSAFGALAVSAGSYPAKLDLHVVAVHSVAYGVPGNKNVPVELRHGLIGNHKSIAVLVEDQTARGRISPCRGLLGASNPRVLASRAIWSGAGA